MALNKVSITMIDVVGTATSDTFLRGDGVWSEVFDQKINTPSSVRFSTVTVQTILGPSGSPVQFTTGIDFGSI
jgi:hypothetical protein